jgi:hypothetical protein
VSGKILIENEGGNYVFFTFPLSRGALLVCVAEQCRVTADTVNQRRTANPYSQVPVPAATDMLCCPRHPCVLLTTYMLLKKKESMMVRQYCVSNTTLTPAWPDGW